MIKKCSKGKCRYFSRLGFNFANFALIGQLYSYCPEAPNGRVKYLAHMASFYQYFERILSVAEELSLDGASNYSLQILYSAEPRILAAKQSRT